jgi:hypothetical protein
MATRTDSFDRTNSSSIGSDWAEDVGDVAIVSNNLTRSSGTNYAKTRWVGAAMDSSNYSVEVVARSANSSEAVGPAGRLAASSTNTYYAYIIFGGDAAYLVEITAGGETILDTGSAITANTNYTLRLEVEGSTIRGYLNGVLDVSATDTSLSSGPPGIAWYGSGSGTYVTTWTASDLASGTTYNQSAAGSLTLSGANVRRTNKALAGALATAGVLVRSARKTLVGALTPAGVVVRRTAKTLVGALTPTGVLAAVRTVLAAVGGVLTLSGALTKRTAKTLAGALAPTGALVRSARKTLVGALTPAGLLVRRTAKTLAGTLATAGALATEVGSGAIEQAVGGTLALAGALNRQTSITLAGALTLAGGISRQISKLLSGALGFAGSLVRLLFGPSAFKADADLTDSAPYTATLVDASPYTATLVNAAPYAATMTDEA